MCCSLDKQTHGNFEVEEFSSFLSDKYQVAKGSWWTNIWSLWHNRMFWIVLTYFLILHPTVWFSHKTYNFLLIVSLTEVLAVALGARLVLVVLPPKRVQLLGNTSEKRIYISILEHCNAMHWFVFEMSKENIMFTCTLSCKPASASPPLLPAWARVDCWGFILSGALAEIFVVNKNSNFRTCGIGRGVCWPFGWELSSNIDEPVS